MPPNKEIPIYPTTGLDDITTKTVDALFNGTAVIEVIKSCVPDIKDPWNMPMVDLDPLLVAIKLASFGNGLDIDSECPKCKETSKFGLNLTGILGNLKIGDYDSEVDVNGAYVKYRPLKYIEHNQFSIQEFEFQKILNSLANIQDEQVKSQKNTEIMYASLEMMIDRISASIDYIRTTTDIVIDKDMIKEFLQNCDRQTFDTLKNTYETLKESTQTKPINIKCLSCEFEYEQPLILNYCDYFRVRLLYMEPQDIQAWIDEMEKEAQDIKNNALKMAWYMRGGISYNDILLLSDKERQFINKIIEDNLETTKKTQLPFF